MEKKSHTGTIIVIFLLVLVIIICAFIVLSLLSEYQEAGDLYDAIRRTAISSLPAETPEVSGEDTPQGPPLTPVDFEALRAINSDVVAWIEIPGTEINYPIAQYKDNDHYLHFAFDGKRSRFGSIFLDYRNAQDFSDKNIIFYGHRMNNGSMFAGLLDFAGQEFFDAHSMLILYTPDANYYIEVFSAYEVLYNDDYIRTQFFDDEDFLTFAEGLQERSEVESDVTITADDRLVTLSTCTKASDNHRFTIHGRLIPIE